MRILDACCGSRMFWHEKELSFVDYQDNRKAAAVNSKSQLYKQAGNAVTVNVTYEIGKHIVGFEKEET